MRKALTLIWFFVLLMGSLPAYAMETDQFNLPPVPLADIGPEVEAYVAQNIQTAIANLNTEIAHRETCIGSRTMGAAIQPKAPRSTALPKACSSPEKEASKLVQLRSPDAVAKAVYEQLGTGSIFVTRTGTWLNTHKFEHEPSRYKAPYTESIYWERPINYATLSPTIHMYGVEFGTDKLDHLFQQGYTYYRKFTAARREGKSDTDAIKAAVAYGRASENLFFGYAVSGVYSNADLAANISGLRFYQNLTSDIRLGSTSLPAILRVIDGRWRVNPSIGLCTHPDPDAPCGRALVSSTNAPRENEETNPAKSGIIRPFITEHLNEAYNQSNYLPLLFRLIKSAVKKRACSKWHAAFPTLTTDALAARSAALTTWHGLEYGYKSTARQVRLADVCFAGGGWEKKAPAPGE